MEDNKKISRKTFLKDVLTCSLGAYGGPEAHYGVFTEQMVIKKKYLTEEEWLFEFYSIVIKTNSLSKLQNIYLLILIF